MFLHTKMVHCFLQNTTVLQKLEEKIKKQEFIVYISKAFSTFVQELKTEKK